MSLSDCRILLSAVLYAQPLACRDIPLTEPALKMKVQYLFVHGHMYDLPCVIYAVRVFSKGSRNMVGLVAVTLGSFA